MTDGLEQRKAAKKAVASLVTGIVRTLARVAHDMGVEFDVADPRVVRWVMLTTFEGLFTRSAQSISKDLPAMEGRRSARRGKRKKGKSRQPLVACDDLVASMRAISE
jgi:hypothetical protein